MVPVLVRMSLSSLPIVDANDGASQGHHSHVTTIL